MPLKRQKTVFIDRDGTMNRDVGYLSRPEDLEVFPFTRKAVALFKESGYLIVVITNQSGIGRGFYDEAALALIHERLRNEIGVAIDGIYFCPHIPGGGCECRKPNLGMIEAACRELAIDMENSWMIGDKVLDIQTGFNAGLRTAMVLTGYGNKDRSKMADRPADIIADDLLAVAEKIVALSLESETGL